MNEAFRNPIHRAIWIIASVQSFIIVAGTLLVSVMLKLHGYGSNLAPLDFYLPAPIFIRHWGFLFLIFPVIWAFMTIFSIERHMRWQFNVTMMAIGMGAIVFAMYAYFNLSVIQTRL